MKHGLLPDDESPMLLAVEDVTGGRIETTLREGIEEDPLSISK
jgi:hypothetical protein